MKILFLDIDGVLNCSDTFKDQPRGDAIDDDMVRCINRVIDVTGCKIIISSAWRFCYTLPVLRRKLGEHGLLPNTVIGVTGRGDGRGNEILAWLALHPEVTCWAAVDDDSFDMGPVKDRLAHTSFQTGILGKHVDQLILLLGEKESETSSLTSGNDSGRMTP